MPPVHFRCCLHILTVGGAVISSHEKLLYSGGFAGEFFPAFYPSCGTEISEKTIYSQSCRIV